MKINHKNYILQITIHWQCNMYGKSLSNLNNLAGAIHNVKCKYWHNDEICETYGIKYKNCECFLQYTNFKDNLIEHNLYVAIM